MQSVWQWVQSVWQWAPKQRPPYGIDHFINNLNDYMVLSHKDW